MGQLQVRPAGRAGADADAGPRAVTRTGHVCGAKAAVCAAGLLAVKENCDLEFGYEHCASVRAISMNISACSST